jgi:hypothetical protein
MSDLLYRLGQRALGTAPRVVPLMRPGRETASIASSPVDSFGETEIFRDADPSPSRGESAPSDSSVKQRARLVAAPTIGQVIAQIFRDESQDDADSRAPSPAPAPSMPGRNRIDPATAALNTPHDTQLFEAAPERLDATTPNLAQPAPARQERTSPRLMPNGLPPAHVPATSVRSSEGRTEVEISIGRIEVHTAPPPVRPSVAPVRRTPALSLDDYLANRRGEKA